MVLSEFWRASSSVPPLVPSLPPLSLCLSRPHPVCQRWSRTAAHPLPPRCLSLGPARQRCTTAAPRTGSIAYWRRTWMRTVHDYAARSLISPCDSWSINSLWESKGKSSCHVIFFSNGGELHYSHILQTHVNKIWLCNSTWNCIFPLEWFSMDLTGSNVVDSPVSLNENIDYPLNWKQKDTDIQYWLTANRSLFSLKLKTSNDSSFTSHVPWQPLFGLRSSCVKLDEKWTLSETT